MSEIMKEAQRCTTICNACRYCEGFCAVFPVMELRRKFTEQELKYFATTAAAAIMPASMPRRTNST